MSDKIWILNGPFPKPYCSDNAYIVFSVAQWNCVDKNSLWVAPFKVIKVFRNDIILIACQAGKNLTVEVILISEFTNSEIMITSSSFCRSDSSKLINSDIRTTSTYKFFFHFEKICNI